MLSDNIVKAAFIISLVGHSLFLGAPRFTAGVAPAMINTKEIAVRVEIDKTPLLPKIDIMGEEKKLQEVEPKQEQPKREIEPQSMPETVAIKQPIQEYVEEVEVINPDNDAMLRYQDVVKQRIEQARRYPLWARKQGIEGISHLYFTVLSGGAGQDIRIIRSSGSGILDEEAIATVKRASPFPPVPKEISSSSVSMEVAIVFALSE
jgi:periplasmic protein TonB